MTDVAAAPKYQLGTSLNLLALVIAALIMLTSSFDIFLNLAIGGNFRFCQLATCALLALALVKIVWGSKDIPALGLPALVAWWVVQVLFVPVTDFWAKSLGYCFWLLLDIALLFSFVQLFSEDDKRLERLLNCYLWSFGIVAICGFVQFIIPILGLGPGFLVIEWWIYPRLPRINGFTYEPSYFASYLLIGFVLASSLRHSPAKIRSACPVYWLTTIAIVISSSRIGICFLLIEVISHPFTRWMAAAISFVKVPSRALSAPIPIRGIGVVLVCALLGGLAFVGGISVIENQPEIAFIFLAGTGVHGTSAHSVIDRENSLRDTLTIIENHPFIGRGLGGISYAIGQLYGKEISSFEDSKLYEGMSVFPEALAASGVIGILPFVFFVAATIYKPLKLANIVPLWYRVWLRALIRALIFEWAVLQFNDNILRPYLWVHLAILMTVYAAGENLRGTKPPIRARVV